MAIQARTTRLNRADKRTVSTLESLLKLAKAGQIDGVAFVATGRKRQLGLAGQVVANGDTVLGMLGRLQQQLCKLL